MLINFYKKITPTMRYRNRLIIFKNKYIKKNNNTNIVLSKAGRGLQGKQTVYTRKHSIKQKSCSFNFKNIFSSKYCYIRWINLNTKTKKKYSILSTWDNKIFCLPHVFGVSVGLYFKIFNQYLINFNVLKFGIPCFLKLIPNYYKISNITSLTKHKPTYATSSGTFCTKIPKKKKDKLMKIILPSKLVKFFKLNDFCFIGKNDLANKKLIQPGKAGFNSNSGFKSSVRGVAMNPVDHPNGGRTKSSTPEKSPWGWVAKLNK